MGALNVLGGRARDVAAEWARDAGHAPGGVVDWCPRCGREGPHVPHPDGRRVCCVRCGWLHAKGEA